VLRTKPGPLDLLFFYLEVLGPHINDKLILCESV
jgi:hypothetical protein